MHFDKLPIYGDARIARRTTRNHRVAGWPVPERNYVNRLTVQSNQFPGRESRLEHGVRQSRRNFHHAITRKEKTQLICV